MYRFSSKKFFISNAIYGICNVSFISILLTPFLRTRIQDPLLLSTTITSMEVSMFIFMYIGGIMFDRFGAKFVFLFGRFVDIISICLLFSKQYYLLLISVILQGVARGIIWGKYNSYIYNVLSLNDKINFYSRFSAGYYFFWDIACSGVAFIAKFLLKTNDNNYNILIILSIGLKLLSIIVICLSISNNNKLVKKFEFQTKSLKEIMFTIKTCVKKDKMFLYLLIFYGFLQYFAYPFASVIGDMILLDIGFSQSEVSSFMGTLFMIMSIGTLIPLILFPKGISVKNVVILSTIQLFLLFISIIIYNSKMISYTLFLIGITFALCEVSVEKEFEKVSNKKIRGTVISISMCIMIIMKIFNTMLIGLLADKFSYHIGGIIVVFLMFGTMIVFSICLSFIYCKKKQ